MPAEPNQKIFRFLPDMLASLLTVGLVGLVFWPGLAGDWGRDDFMQLAMVRLVGDPLAFFTSDHFVLPGGVFRPMGYFSLWLGHALGGTEFSRHAVHSLILHAGTALTLFALLRRFGLGRLAALFPALMFALHPVAIGTALWWSARFDVLALLFVLLAMNLAWQFRQGSGMLALAGSLLCLLAAMLSKETGLVGAAALIAIWQHWAWTDPTGFRRAWLASALALISVMVFLLWRYWILGTSGSEIMADTSLAQALFEGLLRWARLVSDYLHFGQGMDQRTWLLAMLAGITLLALVQFEAAGKTAPTGQLPLLLAALLMVLVPALLQAPVARLNALPLTSQAGAVEAAMQSRLYYMNMAGLAVIVGLLLQRALGPLRKARNTGILMAASVLITALAHGARDHAAAYAELTRSNARLAHDAVARTININWPPPPCHLVFQGIEPPPEWGIYVSMDSIIKALHPDLDALDHCFIHANYPTFYHFLSSEHANASAAPLRLREHRGRALERRVIAGLTIVHLADLDSLTAEQRATLITVPVTESSEPSGVP